MLTRTSRHNSNKPTTNEDIKKFIADYEILSYKELESIYNAAPRTLRDWANTFGAKKINNKSCIVSNETERIDATYEELIEFYKLNNKLFGSKEHKEENSEIITDTPIALVFTADWHLGAPGVDLDCFDKDMKTIRDTDGVFTYLGGDLHENLIEPSKIGSSHNQMPIVSQKALVTKTLEMIFPKIVALGTGNHSYWSVLATGDDDLARLAKQMKILYTGHGGLLNLKIGDIIYKIFRVHKSRFNSILNPTHSVKQLWRTGEFDYDIGVVEHQHLVACESFYGHGEEKLALRTGCLFPESLIYTKGGLKQIKDISSGTMVLTHSGHFKKVSNVLRQPPYTGGIISINIKGEPETLRCTANHPIMAIPRSTIECYKHSPKVFNEHAICSAKSKHCVACKKITRQNMQTNNLIWINAENLKLNDYVFVPDIKVEKESELSVELLEFLGWYAAEGYGDSKGNGIWLAIDNKHVEEVEKLCIKIWGKCRKYLKGDKCYVLWIGSKEVYNFCKTLVPGLARTKYLHEDILSASKEGVQQFLIAYAKGDGCIHNRCLDIYTSSRILVEQVRYLYMRLGWYPCISKRSLRKAVIKGRVINSNDSYLISVSKKAFYGGIRLSGKGNRVFKIEGGWLIPITNIVKIQAQNIEVWDLQVEDGKQDYVANGFTVHNSYKIYDDYAMRNGFFGVRPENPTVVLYPDRKKMIGFLHMDEAIDFLGKIS